MPEAQRELIVRDRRAWRRWLASHHTSSAGVLLVLAKKGTREPTSLTYDDALEEALCFGWIDGQLKSRDESTFVRRFTPRRAKSTWSQRNVQIVERLRAEGLMQPPGEAEVSRAVDDGRWAAAYAGAASIELPGDLAAAIAAEPKAQAMFDILTSTNRYAIIWRTSQTRSGSARARRIAEYVAMLARGETIYPQKRTLDS